MNWFEHHIGDYDEATSHLTACEDGIYSRMIRKYYATEKPLIADLERLQRLLRCRCDEDKQAVVTILDEFFFLEADGWHQRTCDEVIAAYQAGEPEREAKKANENNRTARHREERSRLFKILTDAGQHAPYNIHIGELRAMVAVLQKKAPVTPEVPLPVTAPATLVTATQPPPTNHHIPIPKEREGGAVSTVDAHAPGPSLPPPAPAPVTPPETLEGAGQGEPLEGDRKAGARPEASLGITPTRAAAVCVALKAEGIAPVNPGNQTLRDLVDEDVGLDVFIHAARAAILAGKGTFAYVIGKVRGQTDDAKLAANRARASPAPAPAYETRAQRAARESVEQWAPRLAAVDPAARAAAGREVIDMEQSNVPAHRSN